jgi:hypothetical protein
MCALIRLSTFVLVLGLAPSAVLAQSCPRDASRASYALWAANSLRNTVTGTHPCGRRLTCTPGQVNVKGSRKCHWL